MRCMVGHDVPLNQGCLNPIKVIIPKNSILDPSDDAAVVGGNVLTSQRIVDVILAAFQVCGASQGCMNNVTTGDERLVEFYIIFLFFSSIFNVCMFPDRFGYYETVAGGSGAGPSYNGTSGVHTHMTNTRITDPEILESRYPIILNKFCLRTDGSGGQGKFNGGEGVERELLFRKSLTLSVLTERRVLRPYGTVPFTSCFQICCDIFSSKMKTKFSNEMADIGMAGGEPGKCGENLLRKSNGQIIYLGSKTAVHIEAGDAFAMKTPGGGGYGQTTEKSGNESDENAQTKEFVERGSVFEYRQAQESV